MRFPWWAEIIVGLLVVGVVLWKLPILDIMYIFGIFVLIPLAFLGAFGLIGHGAYRRWGNNLDEFREEFKARVERYRERLEKDPELQAATEPVKAGA